MNLGFGQILLIILVGCLLFSDLPQKSKELVKAIKIFRDAFVPKEKGRDEEKEK